MKSLRDSLGTVLGEVARKAQSGAPLVPVWEEAVGPLPARHSRPLRLENGVLTVSVDHVEWVQALERERVNVLERLRARLGARAVTTLVFEVTK